MISIWIFPKIVVPQHGWFIMEKPIKLDDLGVPQFLETPIYRILFFSCKQNVSELNVFICVFSRKTILCEVWDVGMLGREWRAVSCQVSLHQLKPQTIITLLFALETTENYYIRIVWSPQYGLLNQHESTSQRLNLWNFWSSLKTTCLWSGATEFFPRSWNTFLTAMRLSKCFRNADPPDPPFDIGTPLKINMEHNHGGLEDHFPF